MMFHDASLILAWFGFVFLMLLFRVPFAAEITRIGMSRFACYKRFPRLKASIDRRRTHEPSSTRVWEKM